MFKLKANPTFSAKVPFPVAGEDSVDVSLTFKHRTKSELTKWIEGGKTRSDEDTFLDMVEGWEIDEPFNKENVAILLQHHIGVSVAAFHVYTDELMKHREKNS